MKNNPRADLMIDALLMALWRRKPNNKVLIHSDQGVQYTCSDWRKFLADNNLEASMNSRGNCHDKAGAESFFSLLKTERISGICPRYCKMHERQHWLYFTRRM